MPTRLEPTFSLAFFRSCEDGAVILNANGRVGFINEAARRALGVGSLSEVVQRHWSELWPEEAEEMMRLAFDRVLDGEAIRLAGIDAPGGHLDMMASPVVNAEGTVESVFAVLFPSGSLPRISS